MNITHKILSATVVVVLTGCAEVPTAPSVAVMPAPNKPFEVFVADDAVCKQFASSQINGTVQSGQSHALGTVAATTALGAAGGALLANNSRGAGVGAGAGLLIGALVGNGDSDRSGDRLQRRYDLAYEQCMYAKGNQVPGFIQRSAPPPPSR